MSSSTGAYDTNGAVTLALVPSCGQLSVDCAWVTGRNGIASAATMPTSAPISAMSRAHFTSDRGADGSTADGRTGSSVVLASLTPRDAIRDGGLSLFHRDVSRHRSRIDTGRGRGQFV